MRGEIDFQKYSQQLGRGLFADNVILSILNYKENGSLSHEEKEALNRAKKFLDNIISGGNLESSVFSSSEDVKAAKVFDSVRDQSNSLGLPSSQNLITHIKELRNTIKNILNNNPVSEEEIDRLDRFFSNYSRIHFQKAKSVLETV